MPTDSGRTSQNRNSPVLKSIYPYITFLEDLIPKILRRAGESEVAGGLVRPEDHEDYKNLLQKGHANENPWAPPLPPRTSSNARVTQDQVVDRALQSLLLEADSSAFRRKNVLQFGFRRGPNGRSVEAFHPNTTTRSLKEPAWELLLKRVGAHVMTHLLLHCAIFVPLPNNCHHQVTGSPINDVFWGRMKKGSMGAAETAPLLGGGVQAGSGCGKPEEEASLCPGTQSASDDHHGISGEETTPTAEGASKRKQSRAPSWKRRKLAKKLAKAAEGEGAEAVAAASLPAGPGIGDADRLGEERSPGGQSGAVPQQPTRNTPPHFQPTAAGRPPQSPPQKVKKDWDQPSKHILERHGIFYSGTFPSRPGLPKSCILVKAQGRSKASRILYASMFLSKPEGSKRRGCLPRLPAQLPSAPRKIPRQRQQLLGIMRQVLARARKCPYSLLLRRHCPLPPAKDPHPSNPGGAEQSGPKLARAQAGKRARSPAGGTQAEAFARPSQIARLELAKDHGEGRRRSKAQTRSMHEAGGRALAHDTDDARAVADEAQRPRPADAPAVAVPAGGETSRQWNSTTSCGGPRAQARLLEACSPHSGVVAFLWSAVRRVFPTSLLGDAHNRRVLRRKIATFVGLRRYEKMSVHQALQGLRISALPFLWSKPPCGRRKAPSNKAIQQQRMACRWLAWLFANFIVPILRANFYVTESEAHRYQVFYYRKAVWRSLKQGAAEEMCHMFKAMEPGEACTILQSRSLGITRLRYIPKKAGVRAIANLGSESRVTFPGVRLRVGLRKRQRTQGVKKTFKPVNKMLENLREALRFEVRRQPELLGMSVFGYNEVYKVYQPFVKRWRASCSSGGQQTQPYLVTVDIKRAFDAVDIAKLVALAQPILRSSQYLLVKFSEAFSRHSRTTVEHKMAAVDARPGFAGFPRLARDLAESNGGRVFTDKVVYSTAQQSDLRLLLAEHLSQNLVKFGKTWHFQSRGIPQGSCISSLLCSLYLADLEKAHLLRLLPDLAPSASVSSSSAPGLSDLADVAGSTSSRSGGAACPGEDARNAKGGGGTPLPGSLAMRFIDDFLFVTPSRTAAMALASRLREGFDDYSIRINPDKTRANFEGLPPSPPLRSTYAAAGSEFIKWCGLLINCRNLEVQGDYTRYSHHSLASALSLTAHQRPGGMMAAKLRTFLKTKCHPLFLDSTINSSNTVRLNIYQMSLLAAMKFHCAVLHLEQCPRKRWRPLLAAILSGLTYFHGLIRSRVACASRRMGVACQASVSGCHVRWLYLHAFDRALGRKQARYPQLLAALREEMSSPQYAMLPAQLASVVSPGKSPAFDSILY